MNIIEAKPGLDKARNVAIVTALFNDEFTKKLEAGAIEQLAMHDMQPFARVYVPGAIEIPLAVKKLLEIPNCHGVVALGVVIRGETSHYDYVCNSVERGCSELTLQYGKPVGFGVLTTENEEQTADRCGGAHGNKGAEAAQVVLDMLQVLDSIHKL